MDHVRSKQTEAGGYTKAFALLLGLMLFSACSTSSPLAGRPKFAEGNAADFIARYFTDQTSYVVKPVTKDGAYQSICDRASLLQLARQPARRELAVIVLIHYRTVEAEEPVKLAWVNDLTGLGYRRVVFLRGNGGMQVNGLTILESPHAPPTFAGK